MAIEVHNLTELAPDRLCFDRGDERSLCSPGDDQALLVDHLVHVTCPACVGLSNVPRLVNATTHPTGAA